MVKFFRSKTNIIFLSVCLILSVALSYSVCMNVKTKRSTRNFLEEITDAEKKLEAVNKELEEIRAQLENEQKNSSSLQSRLESEQQQKKELEKQIAEKENEKKRLEAEIGSLKQKITELAAKNSPQASSPTGERICYLTFDDGPSDNTLRVLDILARYNVKATFFVTNNDKPAYIKNIYDAGHTVGLHTSTHNYENIYNSVEAYFADLKAISDTVEDITGVKSMVIRFPGGSSNQVSKKYSEGIMSALTLEVMKRGYAYFDWNVSSGDAAATPYSPAQICQNVLNGANGKNSICVLMHDSIAKTTTVEALPQMIEELTQRGYRFSSLTPETYGYHHTVKN